MGESEKTNAPHDKRMRELFGNKEAFISFLRDCVKPEWMEYLDEESLRRSPKEYILPDMKNKAADVVYEEVDGMLADVIANAKNYERNIRKEERKKGEQNKAERIAEKLLKNGMTKEFVVENTELTMEQVKEIAEKIK